MTSRRTRRPPGCRDHRHVTGEDQYEDSANRKLALGEALMMAILSMIPAFADGMKAFKIRFAGGLVQNILQAQVDSTGAPTDVVESRSEE
jgi:hypothetical protein